MKETPLGFKVEGLLYATRYQSDVVAQRFARRYGRDIAVTDASDHILYYVSRNGKKHGADGKPRRR